MDDHKPEATPSQHDRKLLKGLFHALEGRWKLDRDLHDPTTGGASGKCRGLATFAARTAATTEEDGFEAKEMLYHEKGQFVIESSSSNSTVLDFSRTYVWRKTNDEAPGPSQPAISVWFVKPETESVDYLFHELRLNDADIQSGRDSDKSNVAVLRAYGSHSCVEDMYETEYTFSWELEGDIFELNQWKTTHRVRGPNKQQSIQTTFTRA